jgi:acid phosphatase
MRPVALAALLATVALVPGTASAQVPPHDKVVVIIMENQAYDAVRVQPYAASLIASGGTLTNARGVARPSQPNYFAIWAGNTLGISSNACPPPGAPYAFDNLGSACAAAGLTWRAFSENLPVAGSTVCSADGDATSGLYTRKHAPWTYFSNLDHSNERPYSEFAATLAAHALPNLTFIVPNNCHNSHNDFTPGCGIPEADAWLAANVPPILAELGPNGVLILTYDEDDGTASQHILTVLNGPKVVPGSTYAPTATHYALSKLISELLGLPVLGFGIFENSVTGIWLSPTDAHGKTWGRLKTIYR